jgi:hypothetical protein
VVDELPTVGMLKRCVFVLASLGFLAAARAFLRSRAHIALELLALRQQVAVLRRMPRPPFSALHRLFGTVVWETSAPGDESGSKCFKK